MSEQSHYFTPEEANAVIEVIRPLLREILEIRQKILTMQSEVWPVIEKALGNGGSQAASQAAREFERLNDLVHQIQSTGAILKDLNTGLIDFLALREGREIFLCWKYGEDQLEYWHDLEAGFAGRQRL
jgi:hypothetical protein